MNTPFLGQPTPSNKHGHCKAFGSLVEALYIPYNGQLIERTVTGFVVFDQPVTTIDQAKKLVDDRKGWMANSLKQIPNHYF